MTLETLTMFGRKEAEEAAQLPRKVHSRTPSPKGQGGEWKGNSGVEPKTMKNEGWNTETQEAEPSSIKNWVSPEE